MQWYVDVLRKYAVFTGRARRREYWMYFLFTLVALVALSILGAVLHTMIPYFGYAAAVIVPTLSVTVRRLHDTGKSGWLVLIAIIPLIGSMILLGYTCTEGEIGPNRYGLDPKQRDAPPYMPQYH